MFNRPSLADIVNRTTTDVFQRLQLENVLRRMDAQVYARVLAGVAHGLYGFIEWISRQIIIDTAEAEFLERWASIWGVQRLPATPAAGAVTFTIAAGTADIPAGTVVQTLAGTQFQTAADATVSIASGNTQATAPVVALVASSAANAGAGQTANLVTPILGVQTAGVLGALSGGGDLESDDSLRARLLDRIQQPPQGGDANDYVQWTLAAPGGAATRAWVVSEQFGQGTVGVAFVCDGNNSGNGVGAAVLPTAGQITAVATYIDGVRPVTANVTVYAPTAVPVDFTISGLSPDTLAVRQAIEAELADLLVREGEPGGTILLSHLRSAISAAAGEWDYVLVSPAANLVLAVGQIPVMGNVTWQ